MRRSWNSKALSRQPLDIIVQTTFPTLADTSKCILSKSVDMIGRQDFMIEEVTCRLSNPDAMHMSREGAKILETAAS